MKTRVLWSWVSETLFPWQMAPSFTTNVNMFLKRFFWWSGRKKSSNCYHKLQWDIICYRDTGPSNSEAITLRTQRSERRGGRNEPVGSAYRLARNPGTAEETSGTFVRSQEGSVRKGHRLEFHSIDLFIRDLLSVLSQARWTGVCECIIIILTQRDVLWEYVVPSALISRGQTPELICMTTFFYT